MVEGAHEQLLTTLLEKVRAQESQTAASTAVFLAYQLKITRDQDRFLHHCDPATGRIDWDQILGRRGWSSTETTMLKLAAWLDGAQAGYDPAALDGLDDDQTAIADAMEQAHNSSSVPESLISYR